MSLESFSSILFVEYTKKNAIVCLMVETCTSTLDPRACTTCTTDNYLFLHYFVRNLTIYDAYYLTNFKWIRLNVLISI